MKILGIIVGNDVTPDDNWGARINKTQCILDRWSKRNLTYNGNVTIVNCLVGAGLNYLGSVIACPEALIKKMSNIVWKSFWNGKMIELKETSLLARNP